MAALALIASVIHAMFFSAQPFQMNMNSLRALVVVDVLPALVSTVMLFIWVFMVTKNSVRRAGITNLFLREV